MALLFLVLGCGCLAIAIIAGGAIFLFARGSRGVAQKFTTQPTQQGEEFLTSASLRPWELGAWADLSNRWEGWWKNIIQPGRQEGYTQGVVKSLRAPDGAGWVAFTIQRQQVRNGRVILQNSDRRAELRITSQSRLDPNVQMETLLDGVEAGTITVTYPSCVYHSADGAVEAHWVSELRWNNERYVGNRMTARDVTYDDLIVNGRRVAALVDTWARCPHPQSTRPFAPALQAVATDMSAAEEGALLIALGMALYNDAIRNRRYIYDW
jgi:hypothetical protein